MTYKEIEGWDERTVPPESLVSMMRGIDPTCVYQHAWANACAKHDTRVGVDALADTHNADGSGGDTFYATFTYTFTNTLSGANSCHRNHTHSHSHSRNRHSHHNHHNQRGSNHHSHSKGGKPRCHHHNYLHPHEESDKMEFEIDPSIHRMLAKRAAAQDATSNSHSYVRRRYGRRSSEQAGGRSPSHRRSEYQSNDSHSYHDHSADSDDDERRVECVRSLDMSNNSSVLHELDGRAKHNHKRSHERASSDITGGDIVDDLLPWEATTDYLLKAVGIISEKDIRVATAKEARNDNVALWMPNAPCGCALSDDNTSVDGPSEVSRSTGRSRTSEETEDLSTILTEDFVAPREEVDEHVMKAAVTGIDESGSLLAKVEGKDGLEIVVHEPFSNHTNTNTNTNTDTNTNTNTNNNTGAVLAEGRPATKSKSYLPKFKTIANVMLLRSKVSPDLSTKDAGHSASQSKAVGSKFSMRRMVMIGTKKTKTKKSKNKDAATIKNTDTMITPKPVEHPTTAQADLSLAEQTRIDASTAAVADEHSFGHAEQPLAVPTSEIVLATRIVEESYQPDARVILDSFRPHERHNTHAKSKTRRSKRSSKRAAVAPINAAEPWGTAMSTVAPASYNKSDARYNRRRSRQSHPSTSDASESIVAIISMTLSNLWRTATADKHLAPSKQDKTRRNDQRSVRPSRSRSNHKNKNGNNSNNKHRSRSRRRDGARRSDDDNDNTVVLRYDPAPSSSRRCLSNNNSNDPSNPRTHSFGGVHVVMTTSDGNERVC